MTTEYEAHGKEVLRGREHFADVATATQAEALAFFLNKAAILAGEADQQQADFARGTLWP